jgi:hypothetical protein
MKQQYKHDVSKSIPPEHFLVPLLSAVCLAGTASAQLPPTFDDTDRTVPRPVISGAPDFCTLPHPRLNRTEGTAPEIETASKYNTVNYSVRKSIRRQIYVFRRDFENGRVFVNATSLSRTVTTNGSFRRIKGTQDAINDGSLVGSQLTIPAYDAAILVRIP